VSYQRKEDDWQDRAACRGPFATTFYPPTQTEGRADRAEREARAKAICRACSVRLECLDFALTVREPYGIWGGLSEAERRTLLEP
jgi:WhiB family redox-sensing transcriptional regulator